MVPVFVRLVLLLLLCDGGLSAAIVPLGGGDGDASVMVQMQPMQGILRSEGQEDPDDDDEASLAEDEEEDGEGAVVTKEIDTEDEETAADTDTDDEIQSDMEVEENDPAGDMDDPADEEDAASESEDAEVPESLQAVTQEYEEEEDEELEDEVDEEEEDLENQAAEEEAEAAAEEEETKPVAKAADNEEEDEDEDKPIHKVVQQNSEASEESEEDAEPEDDEDELERQSSIEEEEDEEMEDSENQDEEEDEEMMVQQEEDDEIVAEGETENLTLDTDADSEGKGCTKKKWGAKKMIVVKTMMKMKPNNAKKKCKGGEFTGVQIWKKGTPKNGKFKKRKAITSFLYKACTNILDLHWRVPNGKAKGDREGWLPFKAKPNTKYFLTFYARDNKDCTITVGKKKNKVDFMTTYKCNFWKTFKNKMDKIEVRNDQGGALVEKNKNVCKKGKKRESCTKLLSIQKKNAAKYCKKAAPKKKKTCKCSAWGDVHYICKCKGKVKVDYMGSGPHKLLYAPNFKAEAFNCPIKRSKKVSVQVAFAAKLGKAKNMLQWYDKATINGVELKKDDKYCAFFKAETLEKCCTKCGSENKRCLRKCKQRCKILVEALESVPKKNRCPDQAGVPQMVLKIKGPRHNGAFQSCIISKRCVPDSPAGWVMDVKCDLPVRAYNKKRVKGLMTMKKLKDAPKFFLKKKKTFIGKVNGSKADLNDMFKKCCDGGLCDAPGSTEPTTLQQICEPDPTTGCTKTNLLKKSKDACKPCKGKKEEYDGCRQDFCAACGNESFVSSCVDVCNFASEQPEEGAVDEGDVKEATKTTTTTSIAPTEPAKCKGKKQVLDKHGATNMYVIRTKLKMKAKNPRRRCKGRTWTGFQIWTKDTAPPPMWEKKSMKAQAIFAALVLPCKKKAEVYWNTKRLASSERFQPMKLPFKILEGRDYYVTTKFMDNGDCCFEIGKQANNIKFSKCKKCDVYKTFDKIGFGKLRIVNDQRRSVVKTQEKFDVAAHRKHFVTLLDKGKAAAMMYCKKPVMTGMCQCRARGDVHYKCLCGEDKEKVSKYDYQRSGAHWVLRTGTLQAQSFHCPSRRGKKAKLVSIQVAFAAKIKTKRKKPFTIQWYRNQVRVDKKLVPPATEWCLASNGLKPFKKGRVCVGIIVVKLDMSLEISTKDDKGQDLVVQVKSRKLPFKSSPLKYVLDVTAYLKKSAIKSSFGTIVMSKPKQAKKAWLYLQHSFLGTKRQKTDMWTHCCKEEGVCDYPEEELPSMDETKDLACAKPEDDDEDEQTIKPRKCERMCKNIVDKDECITDCCGLDNVQDTKAMVEDNEEEEANPEFMDCPPVPKKHLPKPSLKTPKPKPEPKPITPFEPPEEYPGPPNLQYEDGKYDLPDPTPEPDCRGGAELSTHGSEKTLYVEMRVAGTILNAMAGFEIWDKEVAPKKNDDPELIETYALFSAMYKVDTRKAWMRPNHKSPRFRRFNLPKKGSANDSYAVSVLFRDNNDCSFQFGFGTNQALFNKLFYCKVWKVLALDAIDKIEDEGEKKNETKAVMKRIIVTNIENFARTKKNKMKCVGGSCVEFKRKFIGKTLAYCKRVPKVCKCDAWGDVHYPCKCVTGEKKKVHHYQGSGFHVMLNTGGLYLEAMHCPLLNKPKLSIQVAFSFRVIFQFGPEGAKYDQLYAVQWFQKRKVMAWGKSHELAEWTTVEAEPKTMFCLCPDAEAGTAYTALPWPKRKKEEPPCGTTKVVWQPEKGKKGVPVKVAWASILGPIYEFPEEKALLSIRVKKRLQHKSPLGHVIDVFTRLPRKWFTGGNVPEVERGTLLAYGKENAPKYLQSINASTVATSLDKGLMYYKCCMAEEEPTGVCEHPEMIQPFNIDTPGDCDKLPEDVKTFCAAKGCAPGSDEEYECHVECCDEECWPAGEPPLPPTPSPTPETTETTVDSVDPPEDNDDENNNPEEEDQNQTCAPNNTLMNGTGGENVTIESIHDTNPTEDDETNDGPEEGGDTGSMGGMSAQAVADPHCENVHGETFDVHAKGDLSFIAVPPSGTRGSDLLVKATVVPVNSHPCSPTVITKVKVEGRWLGRAPALTLLPGPDGVPQMPPSWHRWMAREGAEEGNVTLMVKGDTPRMNLKVGEIQVQVKQRRGFKTGITYFDMQVKGLGRLGALAGGLLGIDDHSAEEATAPGCDPHAVVRLSRTATLEEEEEVEMEESLIQAAPSKMLSFVEAA